MPGGPRRSEQTGPDSTWRRRARRLARFSFPQRYPLVQFPNAPLALALLAGAAADRLEQTASSYARAAAYLAMGLWAYEELTSGVNLFRRLLGLTFLVIVLLEVAHAIHR